MITFFNDSHQAHAPQFEFFWGQRVACFETPARADYVKVRLIEPGQALETACQRIGSYRADALVVALGLDTFVDDPISRFALLSDDFSRLGRRLSALGLPTVFVLEGGYAAAALGINAVNVIEGFEEA